MRNLLPLHRVHSQKVKRTTHRSRSLAAARLQRWAILLSAYCYDIEFKPTGKHANADGLSRLPLDVEREKEEPLDVDVFKLKHYQ